MFRPGDMNDEKGRRVEEMIRSVRREMGKGRG